eukprot:augustus_masked-scaffold_48-processed-gene-1.17-mRNA-1 protein AED:1.00 eAED:1.00 QI:0/0/0/0/1/1/5/0/978
MFVLGIILPFKTFGFNKEQVKHNLLERFNSGSKVITVNLESSVYGDKNEFESAMQELGLKVDFIGEKVTKPVVEYGVPRKLQGPERLSEILVSSLDDKDVLKALTEINISFKDTTAEWVKQKVSSMEQHNFFCKGKECATRKLQDFFSSYQELPAIHERIDSISETNPNRTMVDSLGESYEGRNLQVIWIGEDAEEFAKDYDKPLVLYICNIHAREWLTPLYCAYMAEKLLDESEESNSLLSKFTFVIAPSVNPDGYVYSYTNNALLIFLGSNCVGTDGNRNWGPKEYHCGEGASTNPCSETYCGLKPFDQPETAAIAAFSESVASRIFAFNDVYNFLSYHFKVHSYGQYFMSPWGWTYDFPPLEDYQRMKQCLIEVREAIYEVTGDTWTIGTSANALYIAAGGSDDWHYSELDVIYSNTCELRGSSFQPDPINIMPSNIETFAGMVAHLNCAYNIEFVTEAPNVGPTAFPTSFPTLACRDLKNTGVSLDGEGPNGVGTPTTGGNEEVLDPEEQSQKDILRKWTSATYSTSEEMLEVISRLASGRFMWKIRASHYFDEVISFAKWGWNCKRLRRCKIKCSSDKNCSFEVNIKLNLETSKYIFVVINENHCNHEVKALGKIKKYVQQLTTEELKMIKHLGVADSGIAAADVALHRNFPGTLFDKVLVKRIMKKAKEGVDASEENNIKKLITCGKRCLERGGRFDLTWDYPKEGKAILNGVSFQEDLQNKLKKIYGDSIQVDTTHGMSRYRLVAMFPCWIDCFRKTINFGCSMMESESSKDIVRGLKLLGLLHAIVIMTDGSKALEAAVEELGATLKTWTLDEVVTYHENNVDKYMEKTLKKIKDLIREDKDFSKEADEMFTKKLKLMGVCWIAEELSSRKFIFSDSNMRVKMKHVLEVVEREGVKLQSCTSETWNNHCFTCRHYARYCDRKRIKYMDIDHLPARWRYQEHLLFKQALREMGREVDGPRGRIEFKVKLHL